MFNSKLVTHLIRVALLTMPFTDYCACETNRHAASQKYPCPASDASVPHRHVCASCLHVPAIQETSYAIPPIRTLTPQGEHSASLREPILLLIRTLGRSIKRVQANALINLNVIHERLKIRVLALRPDVAQHKHKQILAITINYIEAVSYTHQTLPPQA